MNEQQLRSVGFGGALSLVDVAPSFEAALSVLRQSMLSKRLCRSFIASDASR